jgi:uncharacterized membrane protein YqaE (UPF0057 family)
MFSNVYLILDIILTIFSSLNSRSRTKNVFFVIFLPPLSQFLFKNQKTKNFILNFSCLSFHITKSISSLIYDLKIVAYFSQLTSSCTHAMYPIIYKFSFLKASQTPYICYLIHEYLMYWDV